MSVSLMSRAALVACAALLMLPALGRADGSNICVAKIGTDCTFEVSTMQEAIDIADNDVPRDTISLGEGTHTPSGGQLSFVISTVVDIVGAGRDKTFLTTTDPANSSFNNSYVIYLNAAGSTIRDLEIKLPNEPTFGLVLNGGTAERLDIFAQDNRPPTNNGKGMLVRLGTNVINDVKIRLPLGGTHNHWGIWFTPATTTSTLDGVDIASDNAIVQNIGDVTVNNSRLTGHRTYVVNGRGTATLNHTVITTTAGSTSQSMGINNTSNGGNVTTVTTNHVTMVGHGAGSTGAWVSQDPSVCDGTAGSATTILNSTTISGYGEDSRQENVDCSPGASFPPTCGAAAAMTANLQWTHSHAQNNNHFITDGCFGQDNKHSGNPNFVSSTDLRPRMPSPLIDRGKPDADAGGEKDLAGRARVIDGDGQNGARRDIGAFEYQRQAPTVTASVSPGSGPPGTTFTFQASGTDADGESLTYIWTFDDGSFSLMPEAAKTFSTLGAHPAEVQAVDPSSLSAKTTVTATVANPPVATPTPGPTVQQPPRDVTGPNVTVKGGTLRVDKKRKVKVTISCPASEPAPCKIALTASSAKKIKLSRKGRAKITSLGKGSGSVAPGKSVKVTLTLTKKAYSYIKRKKKLAARLAVTASDAAGNSTKSSAKATLRPAKR